jgi:hypothetical protein
LSYLALEFCYFYAGKRGENIRVLQEVAKCAGYVAGLIGGGEKGLRYEVGDRIIFAKSRETIQSPWSSLSGRLLVYYPGYAKIPSILSKTITG